MLGEPEARQGIPQDRQGWPIKDLWTEYEAIAMHFNDLIIKLRTQALGAVAAISTLVGFFGKTNTDTKESWEMAATVFLFLCLFWIAIWIIDFCYYNRLLLGAVAAILELEKASATSSVIRQINISTKIEDAVAGLDVAHSTMPSKGVRRVIFGRWAFYVIVFVALLMGLGFSMYEVNYDRPRSNASGEASLNKPTGCNNINDCRDKLAKVSKDQANTLNNTCCPNQPPTREIVIIGNGIAGTAAALNLGKKPVRVYGSPSFWDTLQGLPDVWQTDLKAPFEAANLRDPAEFDGTPSNTSVRLPREAVIAAVLEGLVRAQTDYLETGPVTVMPRDDGRWTVVDVDGRKEIVTGALIVGTGLLRSLRITDIIAGREIIDVRRRLLNDGKIMTGDDCLSSSAPPGENGEVVGIAGAGGNSADCIIRILSTPRKTEPNFQKKIVVWGGLPDRNLIDTKAYEVFRERYGRSICRVGNLVTGVEYNDGKITLNSNPRPHCIDKTGKNKKSSARDIGVLVESLGRYTGDPPREVVSAARSRKITYKPIIKDDALIAVRVSFVGSETSPPLYLIGASATWIPPGVEISNQELEIYREALKKTVSIVNPNKGITSFENPPPGFAVAAFMGSRLALLINERTDYP